MTHRAACYSQRLPTALFSWRATKGLSQRQNARARRSSQRTVPWPEQRSPLIVVLNGVLILPVVSIGSICRFTALYVRRLVLTGRRSTERWFRGRSLEGEAFTLMLHAA